MSLGSDLGRFGYGWIGLKPGNRILCSSRFSRPCVTEECIASFPQQAKKNRFLQHTESHYAMNSFSPVLTGSFRSLFLLKSSCTAINECNNIGDPKVPCHTANALKIVHDKYSMSDISRDMALAVSFINPLPSLCAYKPQRICMLYLTEFSQFPWLLAWDPAPL